MQVTSTQTTPVLNLPTVYKGEVLNIPDVKPQFKEMEMQEHKTEVVYTVPEQEMSLPDALAPLPWLLVGFIICGIFIKVHENRQHFLDFVDRIWTEIKFLRKDDTIMENAVRALNLRVSELENFQAKMETKKPAKITVDVEKKLEKPEFDMPLFSQDDKKS